MNMDDYYKNYYKKNKDSPYTMEGIKDTSRVVAILRLIDKYIPPQSTILDLGCGDAFLSRARPDFKWHGIDLNNERAPHALVHDLNNAPYPYVGLQFDAVVCSEVLEHLWEPEACYKEIKRLVRQGGKAILTTPNARNIDMFLLPIKPFLYNPNSSLSKEHIRHYSVDSHIYLMEPEFRFVSAIGTDARMSQILASGVKNLVDSGIAKNVPEADMIVGEILPSYCPGIVMIFERL